MIEIFYVDASRAIEGEVPYRDFTVEYPFLGFVLFLVPRLCVSTFAEYRVAFGVQLLVFNAASVYTLARVLALTGQSEALRSRLAWYTACFASLCPLVMGPYDLAPMAVAFIAAVLWFRGYSIWGGQLAGAGALLKIFPGAILAPALVWEFTHRRAARSRGALAFLAVLVAGTVCWVGVGGVEGVKRSFLYHTERGLEIESLYAGIILLAGKMTGQVVGISHDHSALHIAPDCGGAVAAWTFPIQVLGMLVVMWRFWRTGATDGVRYAAAAILAFMALGKILSSQYLTWLIPFVAVLDGEVGRRGRWIYLMACIATTIIYPLIGLRLIVAQNALSAILLLNFRNGLLIVLLALLLFGNAADAEPVTGQQPSV
jgi:hypothetical protein